MIYPKPCSDLLKGDYEGLGFGDKGLGLRGFGV